MVKINTESVNCLHCRQAMPLEASTRFCCHGCEKVYTFLQTHELGGYYQMLDRLDQAAPAQSDATDYHAWDQLELRHLFVAPMNGVYESYQFFIPALNCAACIWLIEKALLTQDGVESIEINLARRLVTVQFLPDQAPSLSALAKTLAQIGYQPLPPRQAWAFDSQQHTKSQASQWAQLGAAGAAFGNVMLFAAAVYFGMAWGMTPAFERLFAYLSLIITTAALAYCANSLFRNAWASLRHRRLHIDLPICLALLLAFGISIWRTVHADPRTYFDSITGLLFLLLAGRQINEHLLNRARRLTNAARSLIPASAQALKVGDTVTVAVGDAFPADGVICSGSTEVNEAALTGEAQPVFKSLGTFVYAGTHNLTRPVSFTVQRAGQDCYLASLSNLIEQALTHKSNAETLSDRILPVFTVSILAIAAATLAFWWSAGPERAFEIVAAVLIVGCPCALALATPLTAAFALGRSWKHGVMIKSRDVLERAGDIDTIVVDKTGTLTTGRLQVTDLKAAENGPTQAMLATLKGLVAVNRHPIATAVDRYLDTLNIRPESGVALARIEQIPGCGLVGYDARDQVIIQLGRPDLVGSVGADSALDQKKTNSVSITTDVAVWFAGCHSTLNLSDELHPEAPQLIADWHRQGLNVVLLSGDRIHHALKVGKLCGLSTSNIHGSMRPDDKAAWIATSQQQGHRCLMIGDGINDGAALAQAHVGIAVKGGVDLAIMAADAFLETSDLCAIESFRRFSAYTLRSLQIIFVLAISYNLIAMGLAIAGVLHPLVSALIMPLASLTVLLVSYCRQGDHLWKSSSSSCPLPLPLALAPSSST